MCTVLVQHVHHREIVAEQIYLGQGELRRKGPEASVNCIQLFSADVRILDARREVAPDTHLLTDSTPATINSISVQCNKLGG